jgi:transcriptional antiterminator RfaH
MNSEHEVEVPRWYVIYTNSKQEDRVTDNLRAREIEVFNARLRSRRSSPYNGVTTSIIKPLFPRYIFVWLHSSSLLSKICFTRGVHSVVRFGNQPAVVSDEIISLIKSNIGEDGFITVGEKFKAGDRVVVKDGSISGLVGIFERSTKDADRVIILLSTINYQCRVTLHPGRLERLHA